MNKDELITKLNDLDINPNYYSLDERLIDGVMLEHTLNHYGDNKTYEEWRVFNAERGNRYNEKSYYSLEEAYDEVYERFKKGVR